MIPQHFKFILLLIFMSPLFLGLNHAQTNRQQQHNLVLMRTIGHQILLNHNDSSSRVLPVEKEGDRYKIQFETEFEFEPTEIATIIDTILKEKNITENYIVEVEQCASHQVVYSYEISKVIDPNTIPCRTRKQPKDCYNLFITILDQNPIDSIPAQNHDHDSKEQITLTETETDQDSSLFNTVQWVLVFLGIGTLLYLLRRRNKSSSDSGIIQIGKYKFNPRTLILAFEKEKTELTGKEADLLLLLYKNSNQTTEREKLLKNVWGDEGDYVGRTLDVFISKLRKKLEADPDIKIINIRGVGYKFIINE